MKKNNFLRKTLVLFFVAFSVMLCSTMVFAYSENDADKPAEITVTTENSDINVTNMAEIENMEKSSTNENVNWGKIIAISAGVSIVVTGIVVFMIFNSYKNNGKTEPYPYNQKAPLQLTESNDILVDTRITKIKIEKDND